MSEVVITPHMGTEGGRDHKSAFCTDILCVEVFNSLFYWSFWIPALNLQDQLSVNQFLKTAWMYCQPVRHRIYFSHAHLVCFWVTMGISACHLLLRLRSGKSSHLFDISGIARQQWQQGCCVRGLLACLFILLARLFCKIYKPFLSLSIQKVSSYVSDAQ